MFCPRTLGMLLLTVAAGAAHADVTSAAAGGFVVENERIVMARREDVWQAAIDDIGEWWNSDHTVAGDASRMTIDARPLGCFCESLAGDDGVVHLVVTAVSSRVMLRMTGGLGPLGLLGASGNMTWEFFDSDNGTRVKITYAVGGYTDGGLDTLAEPVDAVIGEALQRLQAYVEVQAGNIADQ